YTFLWCYFRATDSDLYLHSFCLCCKPYTLENQTAPNVRNFVYELLLEYGLSLNTNSFIVTDNEPKMIAALRDANRVGSQVVHSYNRIQSDLKIGCIGSYMKIDKIQQIPSDSGPIFGSLGSESDIVRSYPTLGSDAPKNDHYINKILEHSFTVSKSRCVEVVETFDIIKSLVANFRRSHRQLKLSRELQTFSSTRFSEVYYMMNVFNLIYNELVDIFSDSHYDNFESIDKDLLSHICNFLQVLEKAITTLSDETQSTLNKVYHYEKKEIDTHWPIQSEHLLSTLIHPRLRDFCGNQSLKDQAIQLLQSAVVPSNNSSNVNSLTCDLSASSSVDKSTTPVKANI
ncbi:unnamed protein product, partial [Rotaria socialis]